MSFRHDSITKALAPNSTKIAAFIVFSAPTVQPIAAQGNAPEFSTQVSPTANFIPAPPKCLQSKNAWLGIKTCQCCLKGNFMQSEVF